MKTLKKIIDHEKKKYVIIRATDKSVTFDANHTKHSKNLETIYNLVEKGGIQIEFRLMADGRLTKRLLVEGKDY